MHKFIALFEPQDIVVDDWFEVRYIGHCLRWREEVWVGVILHSAFRKRDTVILAGDKGYVRCMRQYALRGEGAKYSSLHSFNKNPRYSRYSKQTTRYWVDTRYSTKLSPLPTRCTHIVSGPQDLVPICLRIHKMKGWGVNGRGKTQDLVEDKKNRYKM